MLDHLYTNMIINNISSRVICKILVVGGVSSQLPGVQ